MSLQQLDYVDIYRGRGWKKKYKAPSDYCFALKVQFCRIFCALCGLYFNNTLFTFRTKQYALLVDYKQFS